MERERLGERNENGDCDISIFPHKEIHKTIWVSPSGTVKKQINHVLISRKFRRPLLDVKIRRGAEIGATTNWLYA